MRKELKYPLNGLAIGVLTGSVINLIEQLTELNRAGLPFWDNVNTQRLFKSAVVGGGVGALAGYGYYLYKFEKESQQSFNSDAYLREVLRRRGFSNGNYSTYQRAKKLRNELKDFLSQIYRHRLAGCPIDWGSTARGTAINSNFDFDILVPFSKLSFSSLDEMYYDLYQTLKDRYGNNRVRKQNHSVGITFHLEGKEIHFDIVPGREINHYSTDKTINLYKKGGTFENSSRIKTNINAHREASVNRPKEREIIKLIKLYRDHNGLRIKSTFLQHLVIEAFNKRPPFQSTYSNLLYGMECLVEELPYARVVDPGNSNNIISDRVDDYTRSLLADKIECDLTKLELNKSHLKEMFPV